MTEETLLTGWSRQMAKFPYSDTHKAEAMRIAEELGTRQIPSGPHKGKFQRPWTDITRRLKLVCPETRELSDHRLRGAVNRWLDSDVRERERLYQQRRREEMAHVDHAALLLQKRLYAGDPEIRDAINERVRNVKAARADIRITANFRSRFAALLKGGELGANEYGFSFGQAEKIYKPVVHFLAGELDVLNAEYPDESWVIDHKRPLASFPLTQQIDFLHECWSPRNLAVISQSENSRKSSIWLGRRWTYTARDGDECHAEGFQEWRKNFPDTRLVAAIDRPYLDGDWEDSEKLFKISAMAQQKKIATEEMRKGYEVILHNSLLHQRNYEPIAIRVDQPFGLCTDWEIPGEIQRTPEFETLMEKITQENQEAEEQARSKRNTKPRSSKGFGGKVSSTF